MDTEITTQKVEYDQVVVKANGNIADIDDVINVLTIMENSDKKLNFIDKPEATSYLKAAGLITEESKNMFAVKNLQGCKQLSEQLSGFMENLISKPDVMFNSAHVKK